MAARYRLPASSSKPRLTRGRFQLKAVVGSGERPDLPAGPRRIGARVRIEPAREPAGRNAPWRPPPPESRRRYRRYRLSQDRGHALIACRCQPESRPAQSPQPSASRVTTARSSCAQRAPRATRSLLPAATGSHDRAIVPLPAAAGTAGHSVVVVRRKPESTTGRRSRARRSRTGATRSSLPRRSGVHHRRVIAIAARPRICR